MSLRPVIFISAVSKELHSARQSVANCLTALGYDPDWQDIFPMEAGQLLAMLRKKVDTSRAVVQLVGKCHGAEPAGPVPGFGRVSYTQYEALYARSRGKKVYYILLGDGYAADPHDPEPEELHVLQQAYIGTIRATGDLRHPAATPADLENKIHRLRDDLAKLRRRTVQWAAGITLALALLVGLVIANAWKAAEEAKRAARRHAEARSSVLSLAGDLDTIKRQLSDRGRDVEKVTQAELESLLAEKRGLSVEKLRTLVADALKSEDAVERAAAHLLAGEFDAALAAVDEAGDLQSRLIEATEIKAQAYAAKFQHGKALVEREKIVALTDKESAPVAWAGARYNVAFVLADLGRAREVEPILREVSAILSEELGAEHPVTLMSCNFLANALMEQGLAREAEEEHRAVLAVMERALGPENAGTLGSRHNLALALEAQGKQAEAEAEFRAVLEIRARAFGAEHPDTLVSRDGLAVALLAQGKSTEAESELRAILEIRARVLGAEHPDTLMSRDNLAVALRNQGEAAEPEAEHRAVLAVRERVLGPEHPDTLGTRNNLALAIQAQGRHAEAEAEHRERLAIEERVLGPEHPDTLMSRNNLAIALRAQGKNAEAEAEHRAVLALRERILGPEHPDTLAGRNNLANALDAQEKYAEAEAAHRAVLEIRERVLGGEHPDTLLSRFNLALVLFKTGQREEALAEAEAAHAGLRASLGDGHPQTKGARALVDLLQGR